MNDSEFISKAKEAVASVKGKSLSVEQLIGASIDLAGLMINEAHRIETLAEKQQQAQLARMMNDPNGKAFTTSMTDQCFRSQNPRRVANQLVYILKSMGVPHYLSTIKRSGLLAFKWFGNLLPSVLVPMTKQVLRKETSAVILPGENDRLIAHMQKRRKEGVRINLNHLGEAILGEDEAQHRMQIYLDDLKKPEVEYVSVKISTICSQLNLLAWENTLGILVQRLKTLYRAAKDNKYTRPDGRQAPKFVNLDMEEYRDLHLTVELFRRVLSDPEFYQHSAGIVLQSYLPDSFLMQQELTLWALQRVSKGGAPIKIRIVKGANLAMEQVEASLHGWPQAPYSAKADVDANYKRMVAYGCRPEHAKAVHLGIASHNLFDIAYGLLLRAQNGVENEVCFEMLEGMADHMRRVVQTIAGDMLLYCPAATKEEFQNAVAYLVRRLDENTAPENFLRHIFSMRPGTKEWDFQASLFSNACKNANTVSFTPRRTQNRLIDPQPSECSFSFDNEPDTDWSLPQNVNWAENIISRWAGRKHADIPLVIGEDRIPPGSSYGVGEDPSYPGKTLYRYALADSKHIDKALQLAEKALPAWKALSPAERSALMDKVAHGLRIQRADLIGAMVADTGKTVREGDVEVSEAIDFAEYYRRNIEEVACLQDIEWEPKGTVLVAPPWNFPCSIPAGGILAALAGGNCVIFKPAAEAVLVGWQLAQVFWEAGISKDVLQFITCEDEPIGSQLVKDQRVNAVVLTGATATAKLLFKLRPGLDLIAETGGKNAIIVTALSDRDLAIKDLVQSAFGHAGQKCSACSLAILESEVYDDPHFRKQLKDAVASLKVGSPWDLATKLNPLIREPGPVLKRGLTQLEPGEEWLLKPKQDADNPNLWSPGIKLGVKEGSFMHQNELFGPVLGLMRADNLAHALKLANGTPYGLTSGIHSLDQREIACWMEQIVAGNCYVNRGITGAIVQRQPFGGCKESCFGRGAKAGGPNYVMQFMHAKQTGLPKEKEKTNDLVGHVAAYVQKGKYTPEQVHMWNLSAASYAFYWNHYFSKDHDPSKLIGQDNILRYRPHSKMVFRVHAHDDSLDVLRVIAAALTCGGELDISGDPEKLGNLSQAEWLKAMPKITLTIEDESNLIRRIKSGDIRRMRLLSEAGKELRQALAETACNVNLAPVLANGRVELLHYLREVSFSIDYHRYGNLGLREGEKRKPLAQSQPGKVEMSCGPQCCCV